jgi:hypothetical protein
MPAESAAVKGRAARGRLTAATRTNYSRLMLALEVRPMLLWGLRKGNLRRLVWAGCFHRGSRG